MTLARTVELERLGRELVGPGTGAARGIREQVLEEAQPRRLGDVLSQLDVAGGRAESAFTTAEGTLERRQRALGQNISAGERRTTQRRLGLGRALATVDARNREVAAIRDRTDIARSAASSLRDVTEGQLIGARGSAAELEAQREIDFQQNMAEFRAQKLGGLGQIAGIGLSFVGGGGGGFLSSFGGGGGGTAKSTGGIKPIKT